MYQINFTLEFGHKNVLVKFNADGHAPEWKFGLNGRSFESVAFCNAIGEMINVSSPKFKVVSPGLYLHAALSEVREGPQNDNVGYALSPQVEELLAAHELTYRDGVLPNELYRVRFDGLVKVFVSLLSVKDYVDGEPDYERHNRAAYALIKNLEALRKADARKVNIRLFYTEKDSGRFDLLKVQWDLFLAGKFDELADNIAKGVAGAQAYNSMVHYDRISKKATEKGMPFAAKAGIVVTEFGGESVDVQELVGRAIQFVYRSQLLNTRYTVTDENLNSILSTIKARGYQVAFVPEAEEVTEMVIESVAPKATRKNKAGKKSS